jgi:hypothetical protein
MRRTVVWLGLLALLVAPVGACGTGPAPAGAGRTAVQRTLDRHAAALLDRDERAFLAGVAPAARAAQRTLFRNLAEVPLASWSYRIRSRSGDTAGAELRYRLGGYDTAPVTVPTDLTLTRDGLIAAEGTVTPQLWDQGPVRAVRGARSLVLGVGAGRAALRAFATGADRAVPAVSRVWGGGWPRRLVLEIPATGGRMAQLLNAPPTAYRGIAAVTTAELGGHAPVPADRIVVNPDAFGELSALGRQVVLTHEATHVATRTVTRSATPLWLSEGAADWTAYHTTGRTPRQAAPELARDVAAGRLPRSLPSDADFGTAARGLAQAYEGAWLACRVIAAEWGPRRLTALYRATDRSGVASAMPRTLGIGLDAFTARWRAYVQRELA